MPRTSRSSVELDVAPGTRTSRQAIDSDRRFRILILGDFSGRANRGVRSALAGRRPVAIDRDNFDEVLEDMQPGLRLPGLNLEFRELDDFHPDHIYASTDQFQALAEARHKPLAAAATPARAAVPAPVPGGSLLDSLLAESAEEPVTPVEEGGDLADFLKKVTKDHVVPREDPRQKEQEARADSAAAVAMRELLHNPEFQALEAAWRAVSLLAFGLDTDEDLKLYLFDATLEELAADAAGTAKLFKGGEEPWALIVGNYVFRQSDAYAKVLGMLGGFARSAGAPFIAEATPPSGDMAGTRWAELRRSPEAHWIGLVLPRFLLRLPYGAKTAPVESFKFEEMPRSTHDEYLWGNPAFACAYLLSKSFLADGWDMRPGTHRQIDNMPLHTYTEDGETQIKPTAEVLMTEKDAGFLMEQGFMPLASMKNQDAVLLVRFQSVADPVAALAGPWS